MLRLALAALLGAGLRMAAVAAVAALPAEIDMRLRDSDALRARLGAEADRAAEGEDDERLATDTLEGADDRPAV